MSKHVSMHEPLKVGQVLKQSVGLDVSKSSAAVCFARQELGKPFRIMSNQSFQRSKSGLSKLQTWVESHRKGQSTDIPLHFAMEATGVYYEEWAYFLRQKGYTVSVMLPNKTAAFAKSLDYKSKSDKIDAQKLAQMAMERDLPKWEPPSDIMLNIKRLCRERAELVDGKTAFKNRLHAKKNAYDCSKQAIQRTTKTIQFLDKQIKTIEKAIKTTIAQDPDIERRINRIITIKGIGLVTAATIVSEANGFILFKNKAQLVSYAGYDVVENSSGDMDKPKYISKKGNARIRKALYFAALSAVKYDGQFKNLFQRVFDSTKIKMKGYVAVQRKLLVLSYTLFKNDKDFDPQYYFKIPQLNLK